MADNVLIPFLNPLRFHNVGLGRFAYDLIPKHEESRGYVQKFYSGDEINFEVLIKTAAFVGAKYRIYNNSRHQIAEINQPPFGVYGSDYLVWGSIRNTDDIVSYLKEGEVYFIELEIQVTDGFLYYLSEPIGLITDTTNTLIIEYTHNANRFDVAFFPNPLDLTVNHSFKLRVEGGIPSDGFSPESKDTFYIDQAHDTILLDSIPFNTYKFLFGPGSGIPNWLAMKLNRILSLSTVKINDRQYVKSDGAKLEAVREKDYPLAGWKIELIETETEYSLKEGIPEVPEIAPTLLKVMITIQDHPEDSNVFGAMIIGDNGMVYYNRPVQQGFPIMLNNVPFGNYTVYLVEKQGYANVSGNNTQKPISSIDDTAVFQIVHRQVPVSGTVTVTKTITGITEDETYFDVTITGTDGEMVEQSGQVRLGEPLVFEDLPFGTYEITEVAPEGYTTDSITPATVVLSADNAEETVEIVNGVLSLELLFNDFANLPAAITDVNSLSQWNDLFPLPTYGNVFTDINVNALTVRLFGGSNISKVPLYNNGGILSILDKIGCVVGAQLDDLKYAVNLQILDLPELLTPVYFVGYCTNLQKVYLPKLTSIPDFFFYFCEELNEIDLRGCVSFGSSVDYNSVFTSVLGKTIKLTIPASLMTCNGGAPDGDIQWLIANNTVTIFDPDNNQIYPV